MFDLHFGPRSRRCDGVSRRDLLRVGGLAAFGAGLPRLGLPELLQAEEAAGSPAAKAKGVILLYLGGGMSHHDTFDMKPDAPEETRGKYQPIATAVPGTRICELLPKTAQVMDKVALVRSQKHDDIRHEAATNFVLSGRFDTAGFGDHPAIGAVAAHEFGHAGKLPPYVAVPRNPSFTWELGKSAYLGARFESFKAGDPNDAHYRVRDLSPAEQLAEERTARRQSLLAAVDGLARRVEGNDQLDSYNQFQQRAAEMVLSSHAREAFAIEKEEAALRDRYGRTTFGQSCLLARRLVERGVRFVTVNNGGWDHHAQIWRGLEHKLPDFDAAFSALVDDMQGRGMFEETLLVVMGEFGRDPKVDNMVGRNHWARAGSMLFAGPGIQAGKLIGATDKLGSDVTDAPVHPSDVAFTILTLLGINPHKQLHTPDGRPMEILDQGKLIKELFA